MKETEIINTLKRYGRLPTSRIGAIVGVPFSKAMKLLEVLQKEGKVTQTKETNSTYWELVK